MKCDECDNEATVHEVTVHKGEKVEKHLCEECAREQGIAVQSHEPISAVLSKFVVASTPKKGARRSKTCSGCGMTYAEFRQHGLVGCAECYNAFEEQLATLLERAQEGGAHHVGKTPKRCGGAGERQRALAALRRELADAVAAEQYERAAEIRDQIAKASQAESRLPGEADAGAGQGEGESAEES